MIGVFDSGFGGLTVLKGLKKELPQYDYVYFGDNARAPYGNHSKERILEFTREGVRFLFAKGAKLVILACNTASANALKDIQEAMIRKPNIKDKNVLGVVVPIAEAIADSVKNSELVAIIGTRATISSAVYETEIKKRAQNIKIIRKACPLLVPLIEEGYAFKMETKRILKGYLRSIKSMNPDFLVPACTHYPILQKDIVKIMGKNTTVLDTGWIIAKSLKRYLKNHPDMEKSLSKKGEISFYTSGDPMFFKEFGSIFFGATITPTQL